jgi:hypothetical protein
MTKAQLIKENEALRKALRIICTEPNTVDAYIIKGTEKHHAAIEKIIWAGNPNQLNENKFGGVLNEQ